MSNDIEELIKNIQMHWNNDCDNYRESEKCIGVIITTLKKCRWVDE